MKNATMLRLVGGAAILVILTLAGRYNITGTPLLLATFGFAFGFEFLVIKPMSRRQERTPAATPTKQGPEKDYVKDLDKEMEEAGVDNLHDLEEYKERKKLKTTPPTEST